MLLSVYSPLPTTQYLPPLSVINSTNHIQNTNNKIQSHPQLCPLVTSLTHLKILPILYSPLLPRSSALQGSCLLITCLHPELCRLLCSPKKLIFFKPIPSLPNWTLFFIHSSTHRYYLLYNCLSFWDCKLSQADIVLYYSCSDFLNLPSGISECGSRLIFCNKSSNPEPQSGWYYHMTYLVPTSPWCLPSGWCWHLSSWFQ